MWVAFVLCCFSFAAGALSTHPSTSSFLWTSIFALFLVFAFVLTAMVGFSLGCLTVHFCEEFNKKTHRKEYQEKLEKVRERYEQLKEAFTAHLAQRGAQGEGDADDTM